MTPVSLDIRNIPHAKGEPFTSIMTAVSALPAGESLLLIAPFKPEPLMRLLDSRGFDNTVTTLHDGTWQVLFSPRAEPEADPGNPLTWPNPKTLVDLSGIALEDSRDAVLAALEELAPQQVLFALLPGEPPDLSARLREGGHSCFGRWQEGSYSIMVLSGHSA